MWMLAAIAAAAVTGLLLMKLKVPGGMLVGSIIGAAALDLVTQQAFIYPLVRMLFGMGCLPTIIMLSDRMIDPEEAQKLEAHAVKGRQAKSAGAQPPSISRANAGGCLCGCAERRR